MDPLDPRSVAAEAARRAAAARKAEEEARAAIAKPKPEPADMAKTVLETPAVRADADDFMRARVAKKAAPKPAAEPARERSAQAQAPKAEKSAPKRSRKVKNPRSESTPDEVRTILEMQAVPAPAPDKQRRKRKPPTRSPAKKKLSGGELNDIAKTTKAEVKRGRKPPHSGRTKMEVSRVTPPKKDDDKTKQAPAVAEKGDPKGVEIAAGAKTLKPFKKSPKGGDKPKSAGRSKEFSETQWFMKGIEVDADLLETVDAEEYDRDENIGETERRKFTLRREGEE